jgi:hypothetical protein
MNTRKSTFIGSLVLAAGLAIIAFTFMDRLASDKAYGQANILQDTRSRSAGDVVFVSETVLPLDNPTNVATWYDRTQTNFTRINPTNANFWVRQQGSNSFPVAGPQTVNLFTGITNNQTGKQMVFVNGLFIGLQ